MKYILVLSVLVTSAFAWAQNSQRVQIISGEFSNGDLGSPYIEYDGSISDELKEIVAEDFNELFSLQGSTTSKLHERVWGNFDGSNFKKIINEKFSKIKSSNRGCGSGILCINGYSPKTLILNSQYYPGVEPGLARMAQYMWATRVYENQPINCPKPFLDSYGNDVISAYNGNKMEGLKNCDKSINGAYSSTAIFLKNVYLYCTSCTNETKSSAKILYEYFLERVVDIQTNTAIANDR